jgi:IS5 family transposase
MGHLMTENRNGLIVDARLAAPAEMVLRLLILKHIRNWSYGVLEREVRANLVYRGFTRVGAGKTPDAKTMGRWGVAVGPEVVKQIHQKLVKLAQANGLAAGRRMRVDTTGVETKSTIRPIRACWAMACEF